MTNGEEMYVNGIQAKLQHTGEKNREWVIQGPNLKSTINFETKMFSVILSSWTDISHCKQIAGEFQPPQTFLFH